MGQIAFFQEAYQKVIEIISQIQMRDPLQEMRIKWLLSISYCEIYSSDFVLNYLDNFKRYMVRNKNKFSQSAYDGTHNLIDFLKAITTNTPLEELDHKYQQMSNVACRTWCHNKIQALKKQIVL